GGKFGDVSPYGKGVKTMSLNTAVVTANDGPNPETRDALSRTPLANIPARSGEPMRNKEAALRPGPMALAAASEIAASTQAGPQRAYGPLRKDDRGPRRSLRNMVAEPSRELEYLRVDEFAHRVRRAAKTAYNWIHKGLIGADDGVVTI